MGQALYRTHRPKKLREVVGQAPITSALERSLKNGTISHAYLLTGPRGVGKTTVARILAHEINKIPYEDDRLNLDIIEIDAASNRRIDEIRELRDKAYIAPTSAKYKVYIIDEVHMLTKEAFNALLKTLEEPPAHVVFILATTEAHRLPETIISRTQRYAFKPIGQEMVIEHLKGLAKAENISVDDQALELIAAHGEGSFRDSISLLDQMRNSAAKVTLGDVQTTLGVAPQELVAALIEAIDRHDAISVVTHLTAARSGGYEPARLAKQLGGALRSQLLENRPSLSTTVLLQLLARLIEVPSSGDPRSNLEIALLDAALAETADVSPKAKALKVIAKDAARPPAGVNPQPTVALPRKEDKAQDDQEPATESRVVLDESAWAGVLDNLKKQHNTLYGVVRTAAPRFEPGLVTLETNYEFHQKKLNEKGSQQALFDTIQAATGQRIRVAAVLSEVTSVAADFPSTKVELPPENDRQALAAKAVKTPENGSVTVISNIFGGAELLE